MQRVDIGILRTDLGEHVREVVAELDLLASEHEELLEKEIELLDDVAKPLATLASIGVLIDLVAGGLQAQVAVAHGGRESGQDLLLELEPAVCDCVVVSLLKALGIPLAVWHEQH